MISILYSDAHFTAINKPCGMLVHHTSIANDEAPVALQLLRDILQHNVYPVHRIDRPTSGIVLFAHSPAIARNLQQILSEKLCEKTYIALTRGWITEKLICQRDVKNDRGTLKHAETVIVPLKHIELAFPTDRYPTARFSIIAAKPATGRWHQIRQHLAQSRHYIINDRVHGDGKQNLLFSKHFNIRDMFLHAHTLKFNHPVTTHAISIEAPFPEHWLQLFVQTETSI